MVYLTEIRKMSAKGLANGLMTQTNAKHRNTPRIMADDIKEKACLTRDARSGRKNDLIKNL
jgi:hypothetical protein